MQYFVRFSVRQHDNSVIEDSTILELNQTDLLLGIPRIKVLIAQKIEWISVQMTDSLLNYKTDLNIQEELIITLINPL